MLLRTSISLAMNWRGCSDEPCVAIETECNLKKNDEHAILAMEMSVANIASSSMPNGLCVNNFHMY